MKHVILAAVVALWSWPALADQSAVLDSDNDGLPDSLEAAWQTDIMSEDTDGDGYTDLEELASGYSPWSSEKILLKDLDSDKDYLNDYWEYLLGTGPFNPDSDGDLYLDGTEVAAGFNPLNPQPHMLDKRIKVDLASQSLRYYFGQTLLDEFLISGGLSYMPTPVGQFEVLAKVPVKHYGGGPYDFYYPNTKWNLHFTTKYYRYYIHGAYWHNNFGQPMSHGCVNVHYDNMENLYWFAQIGTKVIIE